nr:ATP-grasp fold amidoligase family protein [Brachyspira hyodysenteriae]
MGKNGGIGLKSLQLGYKYAYDNILKKYDWLFIITDSIYGPFYDIQPYIEKKEKKEKIAYGFTLALQNTELEHIQSTFAAIPKECFMSDNFYNLMMSLEKLKNKHDEVINGEFKISKIIRDMGYKLEGFFDDIDPTLEIYNKYEPVRPAFVEMIKKGYPFVRRTIFTKNYYFIENLNDYLELENIIPKKCFDNMKKNIDRVVNKDDLYINIYYPWIRKYLTEKEIIIRNIYKNKYNYFIELFENKTFIEKLNWLKIYNNNPLITICTDKYSVRNYITEKIGKKYLIPIKAIYNNYAEIVSNLDLRDFDTDLLMTSTINEIQIFIGKNEKNNDRIKNIALNITNTENNQYFQNLEWGYKYIKPRILFYEYINEIHNNPIKYKVFCFNSEPKIIKVTIFNNDQYFSNFYNLDYELLSIKQQYENYKDNINKPKYLEEMLNLSKKLSIDFDSFVAIEFIESERQLYFNKFDFYSEDIAYPFSNTDYDIKLGNMIKLPSIINEYFTVDKDTISRTLSLFENLIIKENNFNRTNCTIEDNNKKINLITLFNLDIFSICKTKKYIIINIFGIKLTLKINT